MAIKSFGAGYWRARTFQAVWGESAETPWDEPEIQPGAFAPLSRPSSPISPPFKRRTRRRREQEFLLL